MTDCFRCGDDNHLSRDCPQRTSSYSTPGASPAAPAAQSDGRPRWCGTCDEHSRHIELTDGRVKRCQCHPNSHEQLKQHRKCPTCHATVVDWDIYPCGQHVLAGVQLPYVGPPAKPPRPTPAPEPHPEIEKIRAGQGNAEVF
jgi:hypothetical protein